MKRSLLYIITCLLPWPWLQAQSRQEVGAADGWVQPIHGSLSSGSPSRPQPLQTTDTTLSIEAVEIVSTGYQQIPKERATGSFEHLDREALQTRTGTNILERLEGLAPGLQFDNRNGRADINIRGINTLSSTMMGPLVILDNFPYQGDIGNINPNDVESVTLLKDAAAASIWGARAGNGVIVINTKKAGEMDRVKVEYGSSINLSGRPDLLYRPDMTASDFIDVEQFLFAKGHYDNAYNGTARTRNNTVFSPVVEKLFQAREGRLDRAALEAALDHYRQIDYRKEMLDIFYRQPLHQHHHIGLSGRMKSMSHRLSVGYDHTGGSQIGDRDNRLTLNAVSSVQLGSRVNIEGRLAYTHSRQREFMDLMDISYQVGGGKARLYPYAEFRDAEGMALAIPNTYNLEYIQSLEGRPLLDWLYHPVEEVGTSTSHSSRNHVQAQLKLGYRPLEGLDLNVLYNFENQPTEGELLYGEDAFYTRNLINRFTQIDEDNIRYILPVGAIKNTSSQSTKAYNVRGQAAYSRKFSLLHDLDLLAGYEISHRRNDNRSFWVHGYDPELMTVQVVDPINTYPIYDGLAANGRIPNAGGSEFSNNVRRFISGYFNMGYTYGNRYGVSFSARRDGSNVFGVRTNDRWNPLWSAGVSWMLHREQFLQQMSWVNSLKLRATYGHSGNSGGEANLLPIIMYMSPSSSSLTRLPRAALMTLSNPSLRWEDVRSINLGLDFVLWQDALQGSVEYYDKKSTDLLANDRLDITSGFTSITRNVAEIDGHGVDLRLSGDYKTGGLRWNTGLNFSYSHAQVSSFYGTNFRGSNYAENAGKSLSPVLDRQLYPVFSFRFSGLDAVNGDPQGMLGGEVSKDYGQILNDSIQHLNYHGTALPPYHGSLVQRVTWQKWTLSFLVAFKFGHYFQKETVQYNSLFNSWIGHRDYARRWQQPGDELSTTVPSMVYPANGNRDRFYAASEPNILKGDLVRMQDVGLDYRSAVVLFGQRMQAGLFFKANNLGLLWRANKENLDTDYFGIPPGRRYSFGMNINF